MPAYKQNNSIEESVFFRAMDARLEIGNKESEQSLLLERILNIKVLFHPSIPGFVEVKSEDLDLGSSLKKYTLQRNMGIKKIDWKNEAPAKKAAKAAEEMCFNQRWEEGFKEEFERNFALCLDAFNINQDEKNQYICIQMWKRTELDNSRSIPPQLWANNKL